MLAGTRPSMALVDKYGLDVVGCFDDGLAEVIV